MLLIIIKICWYLHQRHIVLAEETPLGSGLQHSPFFLLFGMTLGKHASEAAYRYDSFADGSLHRLLSMSQHVSKNLA